MAEYKDITELKKQIADFKKSVSSPNSDYMTGYISALSVAEGMIAGLPIVDVVEVVKCENCVHFEMGIPYHEEYGACEKHDFDVFHKSFYCGYAECKPPKGE